MIACKDCTRRRSGCHDTYPAAKCTRYTKGEKTMSKCIYKTAEGYCTIHSDGIDIREYCVEGPCDDEETEESKED